MGWIRVEDDFYDNAKMLAAGSIGRDLYWHGMGFCNRNLTDGIIPKRRAVSLVDFSDAAVVDGMTGVDGQACAPIAAQRLLDAGLWHEDGHNCETCPQPGPRNYIVHDYLKYQPSRAAVEEKREEAKERMKTARQARSKNVRANNSRTSSEVDLTPNPNPNPNKIPMVDLEGKLTQVSATEPPACISHGDNNTDIPCHRCRSRRLWLEEQAKAQERDQLEERRKLKEARENCDRCHGTNTIEIRDGVVVKCDHQPVLSHA